MDTPTSATAVPTAPAPIAAPAPVQEISASDAARALAARRMELRNKPPEEAAAAEPAAPEATQELAEEANAAPQTEVTSETQEANPESVPPIELPRSWTKEQSENWNALPRSVQEYLSERASKDSDAVRRSQNEAAELRKAAEADRKQAEEIRKQYEAKLPALVETLHRQSEFADIRSLDDVKKLQAEDPFRFQAWQVYQMDAQAVEGERLQAEQRQQQERAIARMAFAKEQDTKLHELVPEMSDPDKASKIKSDAIKMLVDDYGFSESDLGGIMQTDDGFRLLNDARWQKLIADGLKYRAIKSAPKAVPQALPPVQRPGVSKPAINSNAGKIQALESKLNNQSGYNQAKIMAEIRQLRRAR